MRNRLYNMKERISCTIHTARGGQLRQKLPHQADLYFLMCNESYFQVGYVTKIKAGASQKHNIPNCISPLQV